MRYSALSQRANFIVDTFWAYGPYYAGIGIFTAMLDGRHFIDAVLEGSPADRQV